MKSLFNKIHFFFALVALPSFLYCQKNLAEQLQSPDIAYDTFFNQVIPDEYRWLENMESEKSEKWLSYQKSMWNKYKEKNYSSFNYDKLDIDDFYRTSCNFTKKKGAYFFDIKPLYENTNPALFMSKSIDMKNEDIIFNPSHISVKDNILIRSYTLSSDSKYLVVSYSRNGSDALEVIIVDIKSKKILSDRISGVMYSTPQWFNNGVVYLTYNASKSMLAVENPKIYYHKIETTQVDDVLIFESNSTTTSKIECYVADKNTLLVKEIDEKNETFDLYLVSKDESNKFVIDPFLSNLLFNQNLDFEGSIGNQYLFRTNYKSGSNYIVSINKEKPEVWDKLIPPIKDATLLDLLFLKDSTFLGIYHCNDMYDRFVKYSSTGVIEAVNALSLGYTFNDYNWYTDTTILVLTGSPICIPYVYELNVKNLRFVNFDEKDIKKNNSHYGSNFHATYLNYNTSDLNYYYSYYVSHGDSVILFLAWKGDLNLNGKNPTLLKVYGGFGVINKKYNDPDIAYFLKRGGVYAYAYIRGSGDLGEDWAKAGRKENKIKSIDDINAAAEYLIEQKVTSPEYLVLNGGSHGALMTTAAIIKRPDLFKAGIAEMGIYDMLRWEKFTVANFHKDEFGSIENKSDFEVLRSYSPYHNIDSTINYPSMLILCGAKDDRVTPFQSYKFSAKLQNNPAQKNPIFLVNYKKEGHGVSSSYSNVKQYELSKYGFFWSMMKN